MALLANLLAQLGIVAIGVGFSFVWLLPGPVNAVAFLGAEIFGAGMSLVSAALEHRSRKA